MAQRDQPKPRPSRRPPVAGKRDILAVTARPERVAAVRRRRTWKVAFATLLLGVIVLGGAYAFLHIRTRFFIENPHYELKELEVKTDGTLARDAILRAAGLELGVNLFRLDLAEAGRRLEALPQVERANLRKLFPATVVIEIVERKPVAWFVAEGAGTSREQVVAEAHSLLADRNGVLMHVRQPSPEQAALPIVHGCSAAELQPGKTLQHEAALSALRWLAAHRDSPVAARFAVQDIDVSRGYALVARDRSGLLVTFGVEGYGLDRTRYADQLQKLDLLLGECERAGQKPTSIDLMAPKNTPVVFASPTPTVVPEVSAPPTPTPKPTPTPGRENRTKPAPKPTEIPVRKAIPVGR